MDSVRCCGNCKYEELTFMEKPCRACVSVGSRPCFEMKEAIRYDVMKMGPLILGSGIANIRIVPEIINVIFNEPATIVFWSDGTKTVVKADREAFDPEKGLAMAICKKRMGNTGRYYEDFKKWLPEPRDYTLENTNKLDDDCLAKHLHDKYVRKEK